MQIKFEGTNPSKIILTKELQLLYSRDIFMKIEFKGTRPSKLILKGELQLQSPLQELAMLLASVLYLLILFTPPVAG